MSEAIDIDSQIDQNETTHLLVSKFVVESRKAYPNREIKHWANILDISYGSVKKIFSRTQRASDKNHMKLAKFVTSKLFRDRYTNSEIEEIENYLKEKEKKIKIGISSKVEDIYIEKVLNFLSDCNDKKQYIELFLTLSAEVHSKGLKKELSVQMSFLVQKGFARHDDEGFVLMHPFPMSSFELEHRPFLKAIFEENTNIYKGQNNFLRDRIFSKRVSLKSYLKIIKVFSKAYDQIRKILDEDKSTPKEKNIPMHLNMVIDTLGGVGVSKNEGNLEIFKEL
jgi:hypothetical protein